MVIFSKEKQRWGRKRSQACGVVNRRGAHLLLFFCSPELVLTPIVKSQFFIVKWVRKILGRGCAAVKSFFRSLSVAPARKLVPKTHQYSFWPFCCALGKMSVEIVSSVKIYLRAWAARMCGTLLVSRQMFQTGQNSSFSQISFLASPITDHISPGPA